MKLTESRKVMLARHTQEIEREVDRHKACMVSMMERQRLELIKLMLVEDTRQKPHDLIAVMTSQMRRDIAGEHPGSAEYFDGMAIIRMLERFAAEKLPPSEDGAL